MGIEETPGQAPRRIESLADRNAVVRSAIDDAIARGDFDDLPGLGKPLTGLHSAEDPDWWIKQKMEAEGLSGVAPAAFQLRKENAQLHETLDSFSREQDVRDYLAGFNERVRAAVMDLRQGPPVFTPPRHVETEVELWRKRRRAKAPTRRETHPSSPGPEKGTGTPSRRRWRRRWGGGASS